MPKIHFIPQSISNRNLSFQNGEKDKIKYSYTGTFTKLHEDYEEIPHSLLAKWARSSGKWDPPEMNDTTSRKFDQEKFALRVKYLYIERNFICINQIIADKNHAPIRADKQWAANNLLIKIATVVLKIITCCQIDLLHYLHNKYERKIRFADIKTQFCAGSIKFSSTIGKFIETITHENNKEFFDHLQIRGVVTSQDKEKKLEQIQNALETFFQNPGKKLEDVFTFDQELPGFDFNTLYRKDLPTVMHTKFVNGHMLDPDYVPSSPPDENYGYLLQDLQEQSSISMSVR